MQFPRFQNPSLFLKEYFRNNPEHLQVYVNWGTKAAKLAVVPLSAALKHLIEIQGLDPNTEPGRKTLEAFKQLFNYKHDHGYDNDFDFSWLNKKFEEARKNNKSFNLTKEEFRHLTDVSNLKTEPFFTTPIQRTTTEAGIHVTIDRSPVQELADLLDVHPVNQIAPEPAEQARDEFLNMFSDARANPAILELPKDREELAETKLRESLERNNLLGSVLNTKAMKDSLLKLIEVAKEIEEDNDVDPSKLMARTKELKNLKETLSQYGTPSRPLKKNGKIRRTPTGKTSAVKETPRKSPKTKKTLNKESFRRVK